MTATQRRYGNLAAGYVRITRGSKFGSAAPAVLSRSACNVGLDGRARGEDIVLHRTGRRLAGRALDDVPWPTVCGTTGTGDRRGQLFAHGGRRRAGSRTSSRCLVAGGRARAGEPTPAPEAIPGCVQPFEFRTQRMRATVGLTRSSRSPGEGGDRQSESAGDPQRGWTLGFVAGGRWSDTTGGATRADGLAEDSTRRRSRRPTPAQVPAYNRRRRGTKSGPVGFRPHRTDHRPGDARAARSSRRVGVGALPIVDRASASGRGRQMPEWYLPIGARGDGSLRRDRVATDADGGVPMLGLAIW